MRRPTRVSGRSQRISGLPPNQRRTRWTTPHTQAAVPDAAPHEGGDRDRPPRVQRELRPRRDIPERVAEWEIAVERVHGPNRIRWGSRVVKRSARATQTRPTTLGCDGEAIEPRGRRGRWRLAGSFAPGRGGAWGSC